MEPVNQEKAVVTDKALKQSAKTAFKPKNKKA